MTKFKLRNSWKRNERQNCWKKRKKEKIDKEWILKKNCERGSGKWERIKEKKHVES